MRVATFNVENLYNRPVAMNMPAWKDGQPALRAASELNCLFNKEVYSATDKQRMLKLLGDWGLLAAKSNNPYLVFRKHCGNLFHTSHGETEIVADGRGDWTGWIELRTEAIKATAIENTARVIADVNPDVLVTVEVENRIALQDFHDLQIAPRMKELGLPDYPYNMVIDGNDKRGIDVGILSRFPLTRMRSHITYPDGEKPIFSRDCPEYYVAVGDKEELVIMPNHFASKGSDTTGKRRHEQAKGAQEIYETIRKNNDMVIVAGDFNDYPESGALDPLLKDTDLTDAMALPVYDGYPGTYQHANAKEKIDYLLLSPKLKKQVRKVDVFRKGFYAPKKWECYDNITAETKDSNQASDHHCLWADIEL